MQITQYIDRTPKYYEKLTITNAVVVQLTQAYREDSNAVFVTIEDNTIRYRIEGGDPTTGAEGHVVQATQSLFFVDKKSIRNLRMIATGGDAIAIVTYYK